MRITITGTITPEIAIGVQGYDFDVRTTRNNVNLHFKNTSGIRTDLVCFKIGNNKYEVEMIDDRLDIFRPDLDKGDILNTSEIVNAMIRQELKNPDMKYTNSSKDSRKRNVTGITDKDIGDVAKSPSESNVGAIASTFGAFVSKNSDIQETINSLDFVPENKVIEIGNVYFIPNHEGLIKLQSMTETESEYFVHCLWCNRDTK